MNFFKQYLYRKMFKFWIDHMRVKQLMHMRNRVANKLPWKSDALAPVAIAMASAAHGVAHTPLLQWEHPQKKTAFTAKAFAEIQAHEKVDAEKALENAAKAVSDAFGVAGAELEQRRLPPETEGGGDEEIGQAPNPATQSIVGARMRAEAAVVREREFNQRVALLPTLGRLGQYVAFEALVAAAVRTAMEGTAAINRERRGVGLFECALTFERNEALHLALAAEAADSEAQAGAGAAPAGGKGKKGGAGKKGGDEKGAGAEEGGRGAAAAASVELTDEEKEAALAQAELRKVHRVVAAELVFSPTPDELRASLASALKETVDLLAMQSARELGLPKVLEIDYSYAVARDSIDKAVEQHFALGVEACLTHYSAAHGVWALDHEWSLSKWQDQGEELEVQDCHDEAVRLKQALKTLDEMRERMVSGCLTLSASAFKKSLYPAVSYERNRKNNKPLLALQPCCLLAILSVSYDMSIQLFLFSIS